MTSWKLAWPRVLLIGLGLYHLVAAGKDVIDRTPGTSPTANVAMVGVALAFWLLLDLQEDVNRLRRESGPRPGRCFARAPTFSIGGKDCGIHLCGLDYGHQGAHRDTETSTTWTNRPKVEQ